jgi:hypothetical protein
MSAGMRATATSWMSYWDGKARRRAARLLLGLGVTLGALAVAVGPAAAQPAPATLSDSGLQKQYDDVFQQMLRDPTNVELTYRFATLAAQIGNYESAITALERLLLFNPNLPRIKIELADLYIHLGSFDVAQVYLNQAKALPRLPPELLSRIDELQEQIDRLHSRSKWTASALVGLRYQSNANAGPAGASVFAGGVPATLSSTFVHRPDWNAFFSGTAQHSYDLGLQQNAVIETNIQAYASKQFVVNQVDLDYFEINSGPRFDVGNGDQTFFAMRPYVLANDVVLGDNQYFWTAGGGLEIDRTITSQLQAGLDYEFRLKRFSNSNYYPTASLLSSSLNSLSLLLAYHVFENGVATFGTSVADENARAKFNSNQVLEFFGSYAHSFQLPYEFPPGPLVIVPAIYRIYTVYGAPDPAISPIQTEVTQEWRYMLTAQLGLTKSLAANVQLMRQVVYSELINFKYNNTQVLFGLLWTY